MADQILVPVDGSTSSLDALRFACETFPDAELVVLHVTDPLDGGSYTALTGTDSTELRAETTQESDEVASILSAARDVAGKAGCEIVTETLSGRVPHTIAAVADERDIDHVVMGSQGREGAGQRLLGSVAERVVRRAPVPVTVVR